MTATTVGRPTSALPLTVLAAYSVLSWSLAVTGAAGAFIMGALVAETGHHGPHWTVLAAMPGWPQAWGWALMTAALLVPIGLSIGTRQIGGRIDGNNLAAAAMTGTAGWWAVFATSLIVGEGTYPLGIYLIVVSLTASLQCVLTASLVRRTRGFRPW